MRLCYRCRFDVPAGATVCKCGSRSFFATHQEDGGIPIHRPTSPLQDGLGIEEAKAEERDRLSLGAKFRALNYVTAARRRKPGKKSV